MKLSDETLKILPYFWTKNKKTRKFLFLDFSFRETLNFLTVQARHRLR